MFRYSEIVSLFHPPTIVKVLGIIVLSFRLLMCVQQMQNGSNPCWKGVVMKEKARKISV